MLREFSPSDTVIALNCWQNPTLKISVKSDFIHFFFHHFIHVYSPNAGADSPLGTKFLCQQEHLVTLVICCKFQKKSLWSLILNSFFFFFFMILYMYITPGQGQKAPRGQNFDVNRKALSLYPFVASFKDISLKSDFIHFFFFFFFHDFIHVYIPGVGGIQPLGDKVLISTETSCHFGHLLLVSNHRRQ